MELAGLEAALILVRVFVLGRLLLHPVLQLAAGSRRNPEIFTATGILLLLKAGLLWALCRMTGRSHTESTQVALLLAQAGEFGFVLFGFAYMLGLMDGELYQLLLLVIALSMTATPLLVRLSRRLGPTPASAPLAAARPSEPIPSLRNHVIVAGLVARLLNALLGFQHRSAQIDCDANGRLLTPLFDQLRRHDSFPTLPVSDLRGKFRSFSHHCKAAPGLAIVNRLNLLYLRVA